MPGAEFERLELNGPFSKSVGKRFRLITATDVIEHLDSSRDFLREAREILTDDGWLAISLPNTASWQGRIKFFLKGELLGFGAKNYISQRHISPITKEQIAIRN